MKTRIITAIVGILVLIGVLFTFDTLVFNFVIAAITLIAIHEVFKALGFGRKEWPMYAVFVPYTLLIMLSSYQVWRRLVMPASFLMVLFFSIYLVVRNAQVDFAKASGLVMFSGIVIFCFYSFIRLKELLPVETYGYDAMFFILLILCFAWGGDTCAYFAGRAFGKHKLCPVVSPKKTVEGAIGGVLGTMVFGVIITLVYSVAANRMEAFTRSNIGVSMYVIIALLGCVAAVLGISRTAVWKAIGRLRPLRVGGELSLSILSYSLGVIAIIIAPFPAFADIMGRNGGFIRVFNFQGTVGGRFPLKADPQIAR